MHLASTSIITADVGHLVSFYDLVTGLTATRYMPDFTEVRTPGATLPWGNRLRLLRDPDGTLVELFAPMTAEAKQRFDQG